MGDLNDIRQKFIIPFLLLGIINLIVNSFLIHALRRLDKLRTISYKLILCLTISDLFTGIELIVEEIVTITFIRDESSTWRLTFQGVSFFFAQFSCLTTLAIAVDRYVHMKYLHKYSGVITNTKAILVCVANLLLSLTFGILLAVGMIYRFFFVSRLILFANASAVFAALSITYMNAYRELFRRTKQLNLGRGSKIKRSQNLSRGTKIDASDNHDRWPEIEATENLSRGTKIDASDNYDRWPKIEATENLSRGTKIDASDNYDRWPEIEATENLSRGTKIDASDNYDRWPKIEATENFSRGTKIDASDNYDRWPEIEATENLSRGTKIDASDNYDRWPKIEATENMSRGTKMEATKNHSRLPKIETSENLCQQQKLNTSENLGHGPQIETFKNHSQQPEKENQKNLARQPQTKTSSMCPHRSLRCGTTQINPGKTTRSVLISTSTMMHRNPNNEFAKAVMCVLVSILIFYLPYFVVTVLRAYNDEQKRIMKPELVFTIWLFTVLFVRLHSCVNAIILMTFDRQLRRYTYNLFRKNTTQTSHPTSLQTICNFQSTRKEETTDHDQ